MSNIAKTLPTKTSDSAIQKLFDFQEQAIGSSGEIQIEPVHYFPKGMYAREITMPKGSTVIGAVHKVEHLCFVSKGKVLVTMGDEEKIIEAPFTFICEAGAKRALHALEETVWTTVHATEERDVQKLESDLVCWTREEFNKFQLENSKIQELGGKVCRS